MSGSLLIQPISIPKAAALDFAGGDVRHVSDSVDALSGEAISSSTRMLAQRDVLLAQKVNEIVELVNNRDQPINLPLPPTTLPGGASQIISNFRIPPGFEARVLNARIAALPDTTIQLLIGHNSNEFGLTVADTEVVDTFQEYSAGTSFYGTGEFVVTLTNVSGRTATATASILLTMRQVSLQKGGIIGPGAVGPSGPKGDKGDRGDQGNPGLPGPPGSVGGNWTGPWVDDRNYSVKDIASNSGSTWIGILPSLDDEPPATPDGSSLSWQLFTSIGSQGNQGFQGDLGTQGSRGPQGFQGTQGFKGIQGTGFSVEGNYNSGLNYAQNSVVTQPTGSVTRTYIATTDIPTGSVPGGTNGGGWAEVFGPSIGMQYDIVSLLSASTTGVGYTPGSGDTFYSAVPSGSNYAQAWKETRMSGGSPSTSTNTGLARLRKSLFAEFAGELILHLPQTVDGAVVNWTTSDVTISAIPNGSVATDGTTVQGVRLTTLTSTTFGFTNLAAAPSKTQILVFGEKVRP